MRRYLSIAVLFFIRFVLPADALDPSLVVTALPAQEGYQHYLNGNLRLAREKIEEGLRLDPKEWSLWRSLGIVSLAETNYAGARDAFQNAYSNGDERAICALVGLNLRMGRVPDAVALVPHLKFYVTNEQFGFGYSERLGALTYLASYYGQSGTSNGASSVVALLDWSKFEKEGHAGVPASRALVCERIAQLDALGATIQLKEFNCDIATSNASRTLFRSETYGVMFPLFSAPVSPNVGKIENPLPFPPALFPERKLEVLMNKKPSEELIGEVERWVKDRPNHAFGWYALGRAYVGLRRTTDAIEAFEKSVRLGSARGAIALGLLVASADLSVPDYHDVGPLISLLKQNRDNTWLESSLRWYSVYAAVALSGKYSVLEGIPTIVDKLPPMKEVSALPGLFAFANQPSAGNPPDETKSELILTASLKVIKELERFGEHKAAAAVRLHCGKNL